MSERLEEYKVKVENLFDKIGQTSDSQTDFVKEKVLELNKMMEESLLKQTVNAQAQFASISDSLISISNSGILVPHSQRDTFLLSINNISANSS